MDARPLVTQALKGRSTRGNVKQRERLALLTFAVFPDISDLLRRELARRVRQNITRLPKVACAASSQTEFA
jgi:hypothetical protein